MENAIYPSDLFIVPFESTKTVRSYANFFKLLMRLRPGEEHRLLHVLSNLSRQPGLHRKVIETMNVHGIPRATTEVRTCGWLAQVDEHGGSIFHWRPYAKGAADMAALLNEVLELLSMEDREIAAFIVKTAPASDAVLVSPPAGEGVSPEPSVNELHKHGEAA